MIRADLRRVEFPDLHQTESGSDIERTLVTALIGPKGTRGEEIFNVTACVPAAVADAARSNGVMWGHGILVVERIEVDVIRDAIDDLCRRTSGDKWRDVAEKLARYFDWEFDGYQTTR